MRDEISLEDCRYQTEFISKAAEAWKRDYESAMTAANLEEVTCSLVDLSDRLRRAGEKYLECLCAGRLEDPHGKGRELLDLMWRSLSYCDSLERSVRRFEQEGYTFRCRAEFEQAWPQVFAVLREFMKRWPLPETRSTRRGLGQMWLAFNRYQAAAAFSVCVGGLAAVACAGLALAPAWLGFLVGWGTSAAFFATAYAANPT